jgi:hypothetical protein
MGRSQLRQEKPTLLYRLCPIYFCAESRLGASVAPAALTDVTWSYPALALGDAQAGAQG